MNTNAILITAIIAIIIAAGGTYAAYTAGIDQLQIRSLTATPLQSTNRVITDTYDMRMISHTEYWTGETGKIAVRLTDNSGNPISVTNCTASILYPDNTPYASNQLMNTSGFSGNHYYDFTVPAPTGVYEYSATCNWNPNKAQTVSSTFHVNPALNTIQTINSSTTQTNLIVKNITLQVNQVYNDTNYIRNNFLTAAQFGTNISQVRQDISNVQTTVNNIQQMCSNAATNSSDACRLLWQIETQVASLNTNSLTTYLAEINTTTQNIYTYITTTLATNINDIFGISQSINNTITQTQQTVNNINTTTTETNQWVKDTYNLLNNSVTMTISSG